MAKYKSEQQKIAWLSNGIASGEVKVFKGESFATPPPGNMEGGLPVATVPDDITSPKSKAGTPKDALGRGGFVNQSRRVTLDTVSDRKELSDTTLLLPDDFAKLALSYGDSPKQIAAREKVAREYLENNGFTKEQIHDALGAPDGSKDGGIDFTQPVEVISFPPPESMTQHVKSHGYPGNWFDPNSNQVPDSLGISGEGRTVKKFKVVESTGLKSVAKPVIDNWTTPGVDVHCRGGGTQLLVNDDTKSRIININPKGI
ncbi:polymorphic toxin type 46 domain-containing protein [Agarivorans gilvus]|nr:polymorphic toxin type 46 domain-containing protein [Agarivorans gilvus]